nr:reverse transcriptase domain-containing protein [Tanacetum cinerariifolium]
MDDEPMWVVDRVVAPTPGTAITIPETVNEFAIKGNIIKIFYHGLNEITQEVLNAAAGGIFLYKTLNQAYQLLEDKVLLKHDWATNQKTKSSLKKTVAFATEAGGIFLYKTLNQAYQLLEDKVLLKHDWATNQKTKSSLKKTVAFATEGNSNSNTEKIMARMDAMTMKINAQYKYFQSRSKQPNLNDDDIPMSRKEEAKFMQTFRGTRFFNDYRDRDSNCDNWRSSERNDYNRDNYQSHSDDKHDLQKQLSDFIKAQHSTNSFVIDTLWI